ncbi:hypothetical protein IJ750_05185 [bacterium]|nr:hypothetical protein [bacterium]
MKVSSVTGFNYRPQAVRRVSDVPPEQKTDCVSFKGKHSMRNKGLGAGGALGLVGIGLWTIATGGVPLIIGAIAAGAAAAGGAVGDALDKSVKENEKKD